MGYFVYLNQVQMGHNFHKKFTDIKMIKMILRERFIKKLQLFLEVLLSENDFTKL